MSRDTLKDFVENGYLDASVTDSFDPYYEPSWLLDEDAYRGVAEPWSDIDALDDAWI